jgi:hypothetical protein
MALDPVREIRIEAKMTRLPGSLSAYLQKNFGISRSTFQRWCARGDVPGAYRTKGGHWRVRKPTPAMLARAMTHRPKNLREIVREAIITYPHFFLAKSAPDEWQGRTNELKLSLAAYGITLADIGDAKFKERDPEKWGRLWDTSLPFWLPRSREAIKERPLQTAAYLLRHFHESKLTRAETRAAVARALGVSISTLYRRYGQLAVRMACEEPVNLPTPSERRSWGAWAK